ncbi:hypothetical protein [Candidatus Methanocrinis natronophilus]|uniref:Uncharacterized protein n=1 Tax=Candidatus Methanocrinis natronophilus TaxID=3033396 RepID=A0ABT5X5W3_9EURY|nr:hypothetical protein [Candidatus Methanocrinis natronophilus]MDF0590088.1 hypothetical protein [Candidatus Methanocrinis natronophilus]
MTTTKKTVGVIAIAGLRDLDAHVVMVAAMWGGVHYYSLAFRMANFEQPDSKAILLFLPHKDRFEDVKN